MAVRFEMFSILGILCWSTFRKRESSNYSVAKCYTEVLIGYSPTLHLVDEHLAQNCKMDGSQI